MPRPQMSVNVIAAVTAVLAVLAVLAVDALVPRGEAFSVNELVRKSDSEDARVLDDVRGMYSQIRDLQQSRVDKNEFRTIARDWYNGVDRSRLMVQTCANSAQEEASRVRPDLSAYPSESVAANLDREVLELMKEVDDLKRVSDETLNMYSRRLAEAVEAFEEAKRFRERNFFQTDESGTTSDRSSEIRVRLREVADEIEMRRDALATESYGGQCTSPDRLPLQAAADAEAAFAAADDACRQADRSCLRASPKQTFRLDPGGTASLDDVGLSIHFDGRDVALLDPSGDTLEVSPAFVDDDFFADGPPNG